VFFTVIGSTRGFSFLMPRQMGRLHIICTKLSGSHTMGTNLLHFVWVKSAVFEQHKKQEQAAKAAGREAPWVNEF
jgi:hypothetical protein